MPKVVEPFTSSLAQSWTTVRGSVALSVSNNRGVINSTTNGNSRCNVAVGSPDMYVQCSIPTTFSDADRTIFLQARCVSTGTAGSTAVTYYTLQFNSNKSQTTLLRYSSANITSIAGPVTWSPPGTPFTARLETEGTSIRGYVNGSLVISGTDSGITTGDMGGIGFFNGGTTATVDDWEAGPLRAPRMFLPF